MRRFVIQIEDPYGTHFFFGFHDGFWDVTSHVERAKQYTSFTKAVADAVQVADFFDSFFVPGDSGVFVVEVEA